MIVMFTSKPDEGCYEISPGVFGRPVFDYEQKHLVASGWKYRENEVGVALTGEMQPVDQNESDETVDVPADLAAAYEAKFGKPPHHRMKAETIAKAIADDQA